MKNEVDKAELLQSVQALLIPLSLFIATLISAAGAFLIYSGYPLGWLFIAVSTTIITCSFVAFVKFQNKLRANGKFKSPHDGKLAEPVAETVAE